MLANTLNGAGLFLNALPMRAQLASRLRQSQRRELRLRFSRASCATYSACCRACNSVWSSFFSGQPVKVLLLSLLVGQQAFLFVSKRLQTGFQLL